MSHKRGSPFTDLPSPKRHLNASLAMELQALRISQNSAVPQSRAAFGITPSYSPFLSSPSYSRPDPSSQGVAFGPEFAASLDSTPVETSESMPEPEVWSPPPPDDEMTIENYSTSDARGDSFHDILEDDVIIEESEEEPTTENRLVIYRPPVKSSQLAVAQVNTSMPENRHVLRNGSNNDWFVTHANRQRMKRKLALVPWTGDNKKLCNSIHPSSKAILMPWHESPLPIDTENSMEIEDIW